LVAGGESEARLIDLVEGVGLPIEGGVGAFGFRVDDRVKGFDGVGPALIVEGLGSGGVGIAGLSDGGLFRSRRDF
jgi:hypothetical protein